MKRSGHFGVSIALYATFYGVQISTGAASLNTEQIEQLTGLKGSLNKEEGVFKVTVPRSDVPISVDGWRMLRSWD